MFLSQDCNGCVELWVARQSNELLWALYAERKKQTQMAAQYLCFSIFVFTT